jgi:hypothetical protein
MFILRAECTWRQTNNPGSRTFPTVSANSRLLRICRTPNRIRRSGNEGSGDTQRKCLAHTLAECA